MKKYFINTLLLLFLIAGCSPKPEVKNNDNTVTENKIIVVSHRADWRNAPENSLQAIKNCIAMGVDMVEVDLNKTKDGHLILMHDRTLNRTTTGKGKPEEYTLEEIKQFYLKGGHVQKSRHKIPTFEETMELCKGKIMVNIDKGYEYFKDAYEILEKTGTVDQCIMKSDHPYEKVVEENGEVLKKMVFMPVVHLNKEGAEKIIDDYIKYLKPKAFELVFKEENTDVLRLIKKVKDSGSKIFINTLWPDLCAGHDDDRAIELGEPEESWGWVIEQGATYIQTDRPALLLEYLRFNRLHR